MFIVIHSLLARSKEVTAELSLKERTYWAAWKDQETDLKPGGEHVKAMVSDVGIFLLTLVGAWRVVNRKVIVSDFI